MAGIVSMNFEERKDTPKNQNHMDVVQQKIKESLVMKGEEYDGRELDGMFFPETERMMICTHKGPMLAKFDDGCPGLEVRYNIAKTSGSGKKSLTGTKRVDVRWYSNRGAILYADPRSGRGEQSSVGWTDKGIDFSKSGSVMSSIIEWLPQMGMSETDSISMSGLLDAISGEENYTMLFIKAVLTLRTLCVGYSVKGAVFDCAERFPSYVECDKKGKVGAMGDNNCIIDLDTLGERERFVAMIGSMEYPALESSLGDQVCCYSKISMPECDVKFVGRPGIKVSGKVPTPEKFLKAMMSLACKLGAVKDLVTAFRATRGWASWIDGLESLGLREFSFQLNCPPTRGCRSVLMDSNLSKIDSIKSPTNMACSLGELICDWACGVEMVNMLFHLSDEFGLANKEMNRNVGNIDGCSVGDSNLREAGFFDYGVKNTFYSEMCLRFGTKVQMLGDSNIKELIRSIGATMLTGTGPEGRSIRRFLGKVKNVGFAAYYGQIWRENGTRMIGEECTISSSTWGATSRSKKGVFELRNWMDMYGLSDEVLVLSGYNAIQKSGVETISHTSMQKINGAIGNYVETGREINWISEYEPRVGSETMEKDRLDFEKTYLGMEDDDEEFPEEKQVDDIELTGTTGNDAFRGSLATGPKQSTKTKGAEKKSDVTFEDGKKGEIKEKSDKEGKIDDEGEDMTSRIRRDPSKTPPKPRRKRTMENLGFKGIHAFLRDVTMNGNKIKIKKVPGDGYCVAHSIREGLKEIGVVVDDSGFTEYLRKELGDKDWFDVTEVSALMTKSGIGVVVYDKRNGEMTGVGTQNTNEDHIIGITYDGVHCDTMTRMEAEDVITSNIPPIEYGREEMETVLTTLFRKKGETRGH